MYTYVEHKISILKHKIFAFLPLRHRPSAISVGEFHRRKQGALVWKFLHFSRALPGVDCIKYHLPTALDTKTK